MGISSKTILAMLGASLGWTTALVVDVPHRPWSTSSRTRSTSAIGNGNGDMDYDSSARAGADGYSVLRQPASRSNWDPNLDPEFEVPLSLDQAQSSFQTQDDYWWNNEVQKAKPKQSIQRSSSVTASSVTTASDREPANNAIAKPEDLDLFQRSLDTLDYPRVLQALEEQCTTVPARLMVRQASHDLTTNGTSTIQSKKSKRIPKGAERAFQPLTADTVLGTQERYRAVQELEWILQGGSGQINLADYSYRNRKSYKETLAGKPPPLGGNAFDLLAILAVAEQGKVLEGEEIFDVSQMLDRMQDVRLWSDDGLLNVNRLQQDIEFVELPKLASCIQVNTTLQDLLHNAFDKDDRLSGTTFPVLGRLRARVRSLKADIMGTLDSLLALPSIKNKLALESGGPIYSEVNGGRLVLPVAQKYASSVGIVHDTSRSGKTVYVEPTELVGPTNELRQAEGELRAEEARVWRSLTEQILKNQIVLETSVRAIGQLDLVMARLLLGRKLSGTIPVVQDEGVIQLRNAKHPVLLLRQVKNVVGSDVDLGADGNQGLVLTGPNSGGKTVILKLLGLMALMSRGGIPVPADRPRVAVGAKSYGDEYDSNNDEFQPRIDFFNPVLADIGDIQSVGGDLSTFSGHMLVCREVLANSGRNALVLMDELGSGTDPAQGVAIAQALLEAILETGARVAITTHYMQLKQLAASDDRFSVAGMQFVQGRPTYKLLPGTVGESFALAVAERLNLPQSVIDRAEALMDSETRQLGDLIRELEDQKGLVDQQVLELEEKRQEIGKMRFELKEQGLRLEKKQLTVRREEARKFAKKLEEKEQILENVLEKLKADPTRRVLAKSWDDIKFVKRDALNEAENIPSIVARKKKANAVLAAEQGELIPIAELRERPELKEGDKVIVCKQGPVFGREATIVKSLGSRVEVLVNNMNVGLKLTQVALPTASFRSTSGPANTRGDGRLSIGRAAERALATERCAGPSTSSSSSSDTVAVSAPSKSRGVTMRTSSNTVDVRGCNLEEAKDRIRSAFSASLLAGRSVVYVLHGHGTGGVLKSKLRQWLPKEKTLVDSFQGADAADGGDAFTRVQLR
jgi:DNA mismatch repair protein MutS2